MLLSATLFNTARALRNGLIVAACCTSLGLTHAEGGNLGAEAQAVVAMKSDAVYGQAADLTTTGVGLLLGAAEAKPLGLLTLGVKAMAYQNHPLPIGGRGRGGFEGLKQGLEQVLSLLLQGCQVRADGAIGIRTLLGSKAA